MITLADAEGEKNMSLPVVIIAIVAAILLLVSLVTKTRWLTLISIFLFLVAAWLIIGKWFTGLSF